MFQVRQYTLQRNQHENVGQYELGIAFHSFGKQKSLGKILVNFT